jgi:hypothetical protein
MLTFSLTKRILPIDITKDSGDAKTFNKATEDVTNISSKVSLW